MLLAGLQEVV